jgi:hypothetical protein
MTDTFAYAIVDDDIKYRDFDEIFDTGVGFSIEDYGYNGKHIIKSLDRSSCTIQEYLDVITLACG